MRTLFLGMILVLAALFLLSGCGGGDPIVGKWKPESVRVNRQEEKVSAEQSDIIEIVKDETVKDLDCYYLLESGGKRTFGKKREKDGKVVFPLDQAYVRTFGWDNVTNKLRMDIELAQAPQSMINISMSEGTVYYDKVKGK